MKKFNFALYILLLFAAFSTGCKKSSVFVNRRLPETTIAAGDPRLGAKEIHLSKDTAYLLSTDLTCDSGQTLSIEAGTLIKVADKVTIVINPGAAIQAKGTVSQPIIFTSSAAMGSPGLVVIGAVYGSDHYWYGIRIMDNVSDSAGAGSGTLSYARIEFAGGNGNGTTLGSLFLQNVNRNTSIDNIQVSYSYANPSFQFSGGNFNARNLVSYASANADFVIHQGYKGMLQNILAYRHPYFAASANVFNIPPALVGVYLTDTATFPIISNLTVLGPDLQAGTSSVYSAPTTAGINLAGGAKFHIANSVIMGFPLKAWYLDNAAVGTSLSNGTSDLTHCVFNSNDTTNILYLKPGTYGGTTSDEFKNFMLQPQFANEVFPLSSQFMLTDPYNYNVRPNPLPKAGSPLLTGAAFDAPFDDAFFNKGSYRGALGTDNWLKDWTNFIPLQTNYNN